MPSAAEWEDWCLETFFLNAAVDGRIDAIEIDDGKIIEFSGAPDLEGAHRQFLSVLPTLLDDYLKGEVSPSFRTVGKVASRSLGQSEERPNFVRILIFFLWLQITISKDKDEGDIRRMATAALARQSPQVLVGLHNMWIALARWLKEHRDIVLELPDHRNETHVGITKRLALASWTVSEGDRTGECLISEAALGSLTPLVRSKIQIGGEVRYLSWRFCKVGPRKNIDSVIPQNRSLRFVDKVRVGARGTYLGR